MPETIKGGHIEHSIEEVELPEERHPHNEFDDSCESEESVDGQNELPVPSGVLPVMPPSQRKMDITDEEADKTQQYVLESCKKLVDQGYDTLVNLQDTVVATADGKTINGYATLMGNIAKVLDTANAIATNKQRMNHYARMEALKAELKRRAAAEAPQATKNTINIVAGREEIMKMLENV